jgi:Mor family transcriptional regulator
VSSREIIDNADLLDAIFGYLEAELPELAERLTEVKEATRREFAGQKCWIPRRSALERQRLVEDVLAAFNGRNATEVARRIGISRAAVYRIIKQPGGKK